VLPNDLEGTSEIELSLPSMWSVVKGQVLLVLIRRASACTKCSETSDFREARRFVHPTTGELSLHSATRFASITNQRMRTPAISKSELVMVPTLIKYQSCHAIVKQDGSHYMINLATVLFDNMTVTFMDITKCS
jgi:hypothetical protein